MAKDQARWLAGTLGQHNEVVSATRVGLGLVSIERKAKLAALVGVLAVDLVTPEDVEPFLLADIQPEMIVAIPTRALWMGEAIRRVEAEHISFGKMYDLYRALNQESDLSSYKNPELQFVDRMLDQHRNVASWKRISDRCYHISRNSGSDLKVAMSQEYDFTADSVRAAYDQLAPFDVLLKTNPYGRISKQGRSVAEKLEIRLADSESLYDVLRS